MSCDAIEFDTYALYNLLNIYGKSPASELSRKQNYIYVSPFKKNSNITVKITFHVSIYALNIQRNLTHLFYSLINAKLLIKKLIHFLTYFISATYYSY